MLHGKLLPFVRKNVSPDCAKDQYSPFLNNTRRRLYASEAEVQLVSAPDKNLKFRYIPLEDRIPASHPRRAVRQLADVVLAEMSPEVDALYVEGGRQSIAPNHLQRALLLHVFYSIRYQRVLIEHLDYNQLFR